LHAQQAALKAKPGVWNAKYSPGGMAELEYAVQFLQLARGATKPALRQHHLPRALEALLETGALTLAEFEHLYTAHLFLRRLINALRMARGQARDLHCPERNSPEFSFLAKRLGYRKAEATAESQLDRDLGHARQGVAEFFRHRFQGGAKPEWLYDSLCEALMDPMASTQEAAPALSRLGMRDFPRALGLFRRLFGLLVEKRLGAACLLLNEHSFRHNPDPEGVLQKWVGYLESLSHPDLFIRQALHHPALLETLLLVFAHSEVLSDWVLREGEAYKEWVESEALETPRLREEYGRLASAHAEDPAFGESLAVRLCRFRNREYLRIALRDLRLGVHLQKIAFEISQLSDALLETAFAHLSASGRFPGLERNLCVLALGKLGGLELNYSSDIDLVFVLDDAAAQDGARDAWEQAGRELIGLLTTETPEGRLFRVDMNLRPWGGPGPLAGTVSQYRAYFNREAGGWELQAWLKARPVCGNIALGAGLIREVQNLACAPENRAQVEESMRKVRLLGLDKLRKEELLAGEVKLGPGGIRTVEFFTQALQIRHGAEIPELITGNTLEALGRLNRYGMVSENRFRLLADAYVFLRRVEHRLQLQGLRQKHVLPKEASELDKLARQLGFEDRIGISAVEAFREQYRKHMLSLQPISAELFGH
jgi:glutamate-ammonia-ligase adenylyltransferase